MITRLSCKSDNRAILIDAKSDHSRNFWHFCSTVSTRTWTVWPRSLIQNWKTPTAVPTWSWLRRPGRTTCSATSPSLSTYFMANSSQRWRVRSAHTRASDLTRSPTSLYLCRWKVQSVLKSLVSILVFLWNRTVFVDCFQKAERCKGLSINDVTVKVCVKDFVTTILKP